MKHPKEIKDESRNAVATYQPRTSLYAVKIDGEFVSFVSYDPVDGTFFCGYAQKRFVDFGGLLDYLSEVYDRPAPAPKRPAKRLRIKR